MIRDTLERYRVFLDTLSPAAIDRLAEIYTDDIHFRDPFSDGHGREGRRVVFSRMCSGGPASAFEVLDVAPSGEGGYLKWRYRGNWRRERLEFGGVGEVAVRDSKISRHTGCYDAACNVYRRLPVLRWLVRLIRKRVGHAD